MNSEKHITQKIDELEQLYELQSEIITRLRRERALETDVKSKFRLEKQIEEAEKEREQTQHEIGELVNSLNEQPDFKDEFFLETKFKLWDMYEQLEKLPLGIGGIAEVYKVKNKKTENISALKILQERHHNDPKIIKRFWAEGRILGLLAGTDNHYKFPTLTKSLQKSVIPFKILTPYYHFSFSFFSFSL